MTRYFWLMLLCGGATVLLGFSQANAETPASKKVADQSDPAAAKLLVDARSARGVWNDKFPGFSCELNVTIDELVVTGQLTVTKEGETKLEMTEGAGKKWVERQLQLLIDHHFPTSAIETGAVKFLDESTKHPLGRMITLGETAMGSEYRIDGDVVSEVNRSMGGGRFTISVMNVERNKENKYLPTVFTVTFWDKEGNIRESDTIRQTWQRIDGYDLPNTIFEIAVGKNSRNVRELTFRNYKLNK
jgi:hypothetical protein